MSILIKGMEMPKSCNACMFDVYGLCLINNNLEAKDELTHSCPLVPVPPHGRLICDRDVKWAFDDAILDEAQKTGRVRATSDEVASVINAIPTIIPADPAEEGEE